MAGMTNHDESLAQRTRRFLSEADHRPRKSRGQNFLIDPSIAARIADFACDGEIDGVIEIGAGLGALTEALAARAPRVVAIEIEPSFVAALNKVFGDATHVRIIEADALDADLSALAESTAPNWSVAGNLPYYAATALIMRALEVRRPFGRLVTMVQREVGDRLQAGPGTKAYGILSVAAAYYADSIKAVARVPRGAFHPHPNIDSTVVALTPRRAARDDVWDERLFFAAVKAGFGKRRKMLSNALANAGDLLDVSRDIAVGAIVDAGIDEQTRAEALGVDEFVLLANRLSEAGVKPVGP